MDSLYSVLFTKQALLLSAAIVALLYFAGKIPYSNVGGRRAKLLRHNLVWRRLLPIIPLFVGVGAAFAPGITEIPKEEWGSVVVFGVWCGFLASHGRKILKRGILDKLEEKKE